MKNNMKMVNKNNVVKKFLMVLLIVGIFLVCFSGNVFGQSNRLCSQGFESSGWENEFSGSNWVGHVARVMINSHNGSYALRGNENNDRIDPITGLVGMTNMQLRWHGNYEDGDLDEQDCLRDYTSHEMYFNYWFRHDDYNYAPGINGGDGKLMYLIDENYASAAMYVGHQFAITDTISLKYSNGGYPDTWAREPENWNSYKLNLAHPSVSGNTNGTWRHFEYYMNYDDHYMMFWIDGHLMTPSDRYADGKIYYDPDLDLHIIAIHMWYNQMGHIEDSTDGTGYYNGWQIDDLEVWDGMPLALNDTLPPVLSNGQPAGNLISGTTSTTISLDTDETAICKYSDVANITYDNMTGVFATTDSTDHLTDINGLNDGNSYTYYIRCQDEAGNQNTDDFEISFSIASPSTTYSISNFINLVTDWLKSESGLESDVNGDGVVNTRDLGIMMSNWQE